MWTTMLVLTASNCLCWALFCHYLVISVSKRMFCLANGKRPKHFNSEHFVVLSVIYFWMKTTVPIIEINDTILQNIFNSWIDVSISFHTILFTFSPEIYRKKNFYENHLLYLSSSFSPFLFLNCENFWIIPTSHSKQDYSLTEQKNQSKWISFIQWTFMLWR